MRGTPIGGTIVDSLKNSGTQGLKPSSLGALYGTNKFVP